MTPEEQIEKVKQLCIEALQTDGDHHKQWYLEQILKALDVDTSTIEFEKGIAP